MMGVMTVMMGVALMMLVMSESERESERELEKAWRGSEAMIRCVTRRAGNGEVVRNRHPRQGYSYERNKINIFTSVTAMVMVLYAAKHWEHLEPARGSRRDSSIM